MEIHNKASAFLIRHTGILLFFTGVLFQLTYIRYGINMLDGGLLLTSAERTLSGEISMVDFFGYPPGKAAYVGLFFKLFGKSILVSRVSMVLVSSATMVLLFYLCRYLMPLPCSVVPSILLLGAPGGYHCRFIAFFTVLNLLLTLRFIVKPVGFSLFIASFTASFTILFRLDISLFSLSVLLVVLVQNNFKRVMRCDKGGLIFEKLFTGISHYFLGAGIPFLFISLYMLSHGEFFKQLLNHVTSMTNFNREVVIVTPPDLFEIFRPGSIHKKRLLFEGLVFYYPFVLYATAFFYAVRQTIARKTDPCVFAILLFGAETLLYPLSFPDFWHAITIYPLVFVITTYLFSQMFICVRSEIKRYQVSAKIMFFTAISIFFIITTTNYGIVMGSIGVRRGEHIFLNNPGTGIYLPADKFEIYKNIISFIKKNSKKGEGLFVVPHEAAWYFLCKRKNPTRFDYLLPGHMDKRAQLEIIDDLKKDPPKFIIYQNSSLMEKESTKLKNFAVNVERFIRGNYSHVISYGEYQILSLKHARLSKYFL